jgi:hypothetical protein
MTPDLPTDEIRRELRLSDAEHRAAMPTWRRALDRVFDPTSGATTADQARLLGLPARRAFLTGGAAVAATAFLAACGSGSDKQIPVTGSVPAKETSPTTVAPGSPEDDIVLLATGQSLELLAVDVYQKALDSGLLTTPAVAQTARLFQSQHTEHGDALGQALKDIGQPEVTQPNQYILTEVIEPALGELTDETSVVTLALAVENLAAATYVKAAGILTEPELRQAIMSIGGVEARHVAVLHGVLGTTQVPTPFFRTAAAAPPKSFVT